MNYETAVKILMSEHGWNRDGAEVIVDELELDNITEKELLMVSEDYISR